VPGIRKTEKKGSSFLAGMPVTFLGDNQEEVYGQCSGWKRLRPYLKNASRNALGQVGEDKYSSSVDHLLVLVG